MYVRVKTVRGRRYAYLVEGKREGTRVKQRVVRYLGPLAQAAFGLPRARMKGLDSDEINRALARIPLRFEELVEARQANSYSSLLARRPLRRRGGGRPRVKGEGEALALLSASRFKALFAEVGDGRYRLL